MKDIRIEDFLTFLQTNFLALYNELSRLCTTYLGFDFSSGYVLFGLSTGVLLLVLAVLVFFRKSIVFICNLVAIGIVIELVRRVFFD